MVLRSNENVHTTTNFIFVQIKTVKLVVRTVSGLDYKRKEFQGRLPILSLSQEDQVLTQIMNRPGVNGLAGVLKRKLIHFIELQTKS